MSNYAFVQAFAQASGAAAATTKSAPATPTTGNDLIVAVLYQNANAINVTAIKDQSGNALSNFALPAVHDNASYGSAAFFLIPNAPSGLTAVQVTLDTSTVLGMQVFEYSGLWASLAAAGVNSGILTATLATDNLSQSVTPTQVPGALISFAMNLSRNAGPNAGTGFTSRALTTMSLSFGSATFRLQDKRVTSTAATNSTFTNAATSGDSFIVISFVIPEPPPAPVLSALTPTSGTTIGTSSSATIGATTDTGNGTMYGVLTASSLTGVTGPQIAAGQNAAGSTSGVASSNLAITAAGAKTLPALTGLAANTTYNFAVVHNGAGGYSNILQGTLTTHAPVPTITGVSPSPLVEGSSATITGTTFTATKGAGHADLAGVAQTTTAWSDTSITYTVALGLNKYGAAIAQTVTNNAGDVSAAFNVTISPAAGASYVDIVTPDTTATHRLQTVGGGDLSAGDQVCIFNIVGTGSVTVFSDGTYVADAGVISFDYKVWTAGSGYGATGTKTLGAAAPSGSVVVINW